jgi:hypothetical protein
MMKMARMKMSMRVASHANVSTRAARAALLVIGVVLFAILGIAVPYKTYEYFKAKQDAAAASLLHEEL